MRIVLASSNKHKVQEINEITSRISDGVEFVLPPTDFDPEENGETFEENSYIKAKAAWEISHSWVLADDSGLCIDSLGGKPGIYSARYAETPALRIERVLNEMKDIPPAKRSAHFTCAMTLINPEGEIAYKVEGICNGSIVESARGINGFGYDPIFLVEGDTRTMAELSEDEKNEISHRSVALRKVIDFLRSKKWVL